MSVETSTTTKKAAKPSRKGKKAWRKNVDVTEVEEQLHELRSEERLGGPLHKKADNALFFTDKAGDAEIKRRYKHSKLRIDEILTPSSALSGVTSRSTAKSTVKVEVPGVKVRQASKTNAALIDRLAKRKLETGAASVGAAAEERARRLAEKRRKLAQKKGGFDLWAVTDVVDDSTEYLEVTKPKPVKKPNLPVEKPIAIPAVELTHEGASYNPSFDDHQRALRNAVDEEVAKLKQKEHTLKKLSYPAELDNLDDETFFGDSDDEEENGEQEDGGVETAAATSSKDDGLSHTRMVTEARKTKAQRNKELRRAAKEREAEKQREEKLLAKQLNRLGEINKVVTQQEREQQRQLEERAKLQEEKAKRETKRLGPHLFKALPMDVQLTEDLPDSLRELKPEGNLFKDRFLSLQKRSLIEARVPVSKRLKYRRKEVETHDYKRFK
ncbi:uncharacterized protein SPPG_02283 [Spizellomyces punctatus DAOM BR117]|uniref:Ribosome biogenesis protein NOP53 n=1 Tax=Spizellomyces punctatus (strain DAOM BR117) TaxID=645134 RepID=A0A0L0HQW7_SPIPD|nr:uncharacterized protein SPPG_02283 [Spizellomyces punctatus DAOM BR117]KND03229.1 hypothetical protein SPPG_02283 [Spizellomyces punctatus DAOM BR117]|eukprot:XP_016611268.1 hypothetical protein SPPG_02283 [Spizellomyces punctatus DAOM BR117]